MVHRRLAYFVFQGSCAVGPFTFSACLLALGFQRGDGRGVTNMMRDVWHGLFFLFLLLPSSSLLNPLQYLLAGFYLSMFFRCFGSHTLVCLDMYICMLRSAYISWKVPSLWIFLPIGFLSNCDLSSTIYPSKYPPLPLVHIIVYCNCLTIQFRSESCDSVIGPRFPNGNNVEVRLLPSSCKFLAFAFTFCLPRAYSAGSTGQYNPPSRALRHTPTETRSLDTHSTHTQRHPRTAPSRRKKTIPGSTSIPRLQQPLVQYQHPTSSIQHPASSFIHELRAMSRPSAKLCAECFPALRPRPQARALRSATTSARRVRDRSYTTTTHVLPVPCVRPRAQHTQHALSATTGLTVPRLQQQCRARGLASASEGKEAKAGPEDGPLREYDVRVEEGRLRDDPYQRGESHNATSTSKSASHPQPHPARIEKQRTL